MPTYEVNVSAFAEGPFPGDRFPGMPGYQGPRRFDARPGVPGIQRDVRPGVPGIQRDTRPNIPGYQPGFDTRPNIPGYQPGPGPGPRGQVQNRLEHLQAPQLHTLIRQRAVRAMQERDRNHAHVVRLSAGIEGGKLAAAEKAKQIGARRIAAARALQWHLRQQRYHVAQAFVQKATQTSDPKVKEALRQATLRVLRTPVRISKGVVQVVCPGQSVRGFGFLPGSGYTGSEMVPQVPSGFMPASPAAAMRRAFATQIPQGMNPPASMQLPSIHPLPPSVAAAQPGLPRFYPQIPHSVGTSLPPVPPRPDRSIVVVPAANQNPAYHRPDMPRRGMQPMMMQAPTQAAVAVRVLGPDVVLPGHVAPMMLPAAASATSGFYGFGADQEIHISGLGEDIIIADVQETALAESINAVEYEAAIGAASQQEINISGDLGAVRFKEVLIRFKIPQIKLFPIQLRAHKLKMGKRLSHQLTAVGLAHATGIAGPAAGLIPGGPLAAGIIALLAGKHAKEESSLATEMGRRVSSTAVKSRAVKIASEITTAARRPVCR